MRRVLLVLLALLSFGTIFAEAVVSEKKDISVFPMFSSENLPTAAYKYFDDLLIEQLSSMKRFQVIGYQFRLDGDSAEDFIAKIQTLKKQRALSNPKYIDADLGVAVIPATEMEKLANSFFIFIPSIVGYSTTSYNVEVKEYKDGREVIRIKKMYKAEVAISVKIITAEGDLMDTYNRKVEAESEKGSVDAYQKAASSAIGGLGFYLRTLDQFKLRTQVLKVDGGQIAMQLGHDLGVKSGYEFVIQENEIMMNLTNKKNVGLVRVNNITDQWSYATTIFGAPKVGDQLVEAPLVGGRVNLFAGLMPMKIDDTSVFVRCYEDNSSISFDATSEFKASSYVPGVALDFEFELDYSWLLDFNMGLLIGSPLAFYVDMGPAYELYFGPVSVGLGLDFSLMGNYTYFGKLMLGAGYAKFGGTNYTGNVDVSLVGFVFGIKPKIDLNFQVSQGFKLRVLAGYALYFNAASWYKVSFSGTDEYGSSATSSVDSDQYDFYVNGTASKALPIDYSGPFGGVEFIFRF